MILNENLDLPDPRDIPLQDLARILSDAIRFRMPNGSETTEHDCEVMECTIEVLMDDDALLKAIEDYVQRTQTPNPASGKTVAFFP